MKLYPVFFVFLVIAFGCKKKVNNHYYMVGQEEKLIAEYNLFSENASKEFEEHKTLIVEEIPDAIEEKQEEQSVFKALGCCSDNQKRLSHDCCCEDVLKSYAELTDEKRTTVKNSADPILADCKTFRKYSSKFDEIENPISELEEEEAY